MCVGGVLSFCLVGCLLAFYLVIGVFLLLLFGWFGVGVLVGLFAFLPYILLLYVSDFSLIIPYFLLGWKALAVHQHYQSLFQTLASDSVSRGFLVFSMGLSIMPLRMVP